MLGGRTVTLKFEKPGVEEVAKEDRDERLFEDRAEVYLEILDKVCTRMFYGLCIYVVLDTRRKVAVARASRPR